MSWWTKIVEGIKGGSTHEAKLPKASPPPEGKYLGALTYHPDPEDPREQEKINQLHPAVAEMCRRHLALARLNGLKVYVFEAERSMERQAKLYGKGRDAKGNIVDKRKVVTMAKPGNSYHNYGLAYDLVFDGDKLKPGVQWSWDDKSSQAADAKRRSDWMSLGKAGTDCGLEWAGAWKRFREYPHFQQTCGLKIKDLKRIWDIGGRDAVWAEIDRRLASK